MIIVHHLEDSRSQRVLWLLEELGVDYEVKRYERDKETSLAPAALKAVHPLGKSPVIEEDGEIVAETGAIVEYLVDRHGPEFRPASGTPAYRDYVYWLHFAEGSLMPQLLLLLFFTRMKEAKMPFFAKPIASGMANKVIGDYVAPNVKNQMTFIGNHLAGRDWFAGDALSGADVMMSFPLEAAAKRVSEAVGGGPWTAPVDGYLKRVQARPAYQRALERGGPYAYA